MLYQKLLTVGRRRHRDRRNAKENRTKLETTEDESCDSNTMLEHLKI